VLEMMQHSRASLLTLQRLLQELVDLMERARNLANWAHPGKVGR
jgi:hypothetical protein